MYETSDIRFVMRETAALAERVDGLKASIEKISPALEKALDRHSAELKERICEVKTDLKESHDKVVDLQHKVAFVKGAMWVFGILFTVALVLVAAFARKWIG